ncbi:MULTISPECIES: type IV pilus modification PilV family protein [Deinococcus]|uniref:Type II secretion system protein n=1 Tax=Deinococcus rufus TaxID=2136097 RepID=A0ABV7Z4U9_9DEIO|nr:type II secretion system protein [Deinococcus sp. AB2017081]WQE95299.1 type II secretion system protein [Deinococcus sp. AB2017081]
MRSDATQGITIVEVLVAMLVLGIAMGSVMSGLLANTSVNSRVGNKAEAVRITEEKLEGYRQDGDYTTLSTSLPVTETITRKGMNYTVKTTFCPSDKPTTMVCSKTAVYIRVEVTNGNTELYKADTYYTSFGQE